MFYIILGMKIDLTAHIMRNCYFTSIKNLSVGKRSIIGHNCVLDAKGGINIGKDVNISSYSKIFTAKHLVNDVNFKGAHNPVTIDNRVWIASNVIILQGIKIGEGAVIAAGSVVTKSIEPFVIAGGVPAKKIGSRNSNIDYKLSSKPSRFL
jgi:maltose O-acetyltransferase